MSGLTTTWARLTPAGRALAVLLPIVVIGGAGTTALLVAFGGAIGATIGANMATTPAIGFVTFAAAARASSICCFNRASRRVA